MPQVVLELIELSLLRGNEREFRLNISIFSLNRRFILSGSFSGGQGKIS